MQGPGGAGDTDTNDTTRQHDSEDASKKTARIMGYESQGYNCMTRTTRETRERRHGVRGRWGVMRRVWLMVGGSARRRRRARVGGEASSRDDARFHRSEEYGQCATAAVCCVPWPVCNAGG